MRVVSFIENNLIFSEQYSFYDVKVSAATSVGEGRNASIKFRTAENSKCCYTAY